MNLILFASKIMAVIKAVPKTIWGGISYEKVDYSNFKHYINLVNRI